MYYRDSEFYTSNSSVEMCDKADALYVGIESYEELEKENNELKAQVELLKQSLLKCAELVNVYGGAAIDWLIDNQHDLLRQAKAGE